MKNNHKQMFHLAVGAVLAIMFAQVPAEKRTRVGSAKKGNEAGLDISADQFPEDMGATVREFAPVQQGERFEPPPERTEPLEHEFQVPEAGKR